MGRGKVALKKIENKVKRQVSFSKRRSGLLKKAREISLLCDADVGLIVFSTTGKLAHFATDASMERILEKYERHSHEERHLTTFGKESYEYCTLQHANLESKLELLQKNERHIMGEDLDSLSVKELQNLEQQLDMALKHIRLRQNQVMFESISTLRNKGKEMRNQHNVLLKKKYGIQLTVDAVICSSEFIRSIADQNEAAKAAGYHAGLIVGYEAYEGTEDLETVKGYDLHSLQKFKDSQLAFGRMSFPVIKKLSDYGSLEELKSVLEPAE